MGSDVDIPISIDAQTVTLDINIASSAVTLDINIASSAITLDINIASSAVTLDVDIAAQSVGDLAIDIAAQSVGNIGIDIAAQSQANLTISLAAQAIDLDINLEGPTGGYAVEVTSDFSVYQQPYSRRAETTQGGESAISADNRYTLTNSTHFYNPLLEVYSSAACKMTVEFRVGDDYFVLGVFYMDAGQRRGWVMCDLEGTPIGAWTKGNVYVTPDADTTMRVYISHCP